MANIRTEELAVKFRIYHDHSPSLKDAVVSFFRSSKKASHSDFWAVNKVSLHIKAGERVGIVGRNGAGKSTFLKALCRIYEPSSGTIKVTGHIAPLLEIGAGFHPEFTGRENIHLNGAILGFRPEQLSVIESEIISFAELQEFIDTPVKYYSTGMYLRLAFSIATAVEPEILILDEMFAGGDAGFVLKATARMKKVVEAASIMILVSHDVDLLASICNRVIWLEKGEVLHDGPALEVLALYKAFSASLAAA